MKISRRHLFQVVVIACIAGNAIAQTGTPFSGRVRDIDYSSAQTQVILSGTAPTDELVATVASDRVQGVLQSALVSGRTAKVSHLNHKIQSATLLSSPTTCAGPGCVEQLSCSVGSCKATISGHQGDVSTTDRRALGILLTAVNKGVPVSELMTEKNGTIKRVKVNVP
jgi:hypothetical protein